MSSMSLLKRRPALSRVLRRDNAKDSGHQATIPRDLAENLSRQLRLGAAATKAVIMAVCSVQRKQERTLAVYGHEAFSVPAEIGPFGACDNSEPEVWDAATARSRWPSHPLTRTLQEPMVLVTRLLGVTARRPRGILYVLCAKGALNSGELAWIDDTATLVERELRWVDQLLDIASKREQAAVEVARIFDDLAGEHWIYRQLVHQLPNRAVMVFDRDLTVRLAHGEALLARAGISASACLRKRVASALKGRRGKQLQLEFAAALEGQERCFALEHSGRFLDVNAVPIRDSTGGVVFGMALFHDATVQHRRVAVERLLVTRLRALVDNLHAGILVEDENSHVEICNEKFCELFQLDENPNAFVGRSSLELVRRVSPICFVPDAFEEGIVERIQAAQPFRNEFVYLADMRILERDYVPLHVDQRNVGHLWVYRDVTQREQNRDLLQRQADELRALSLVDELTGLYNRRGFLTLTTQQLKLCDRSMRPALVVFVDLDGMKRINDELGHDVGDRALIETASVLRQVFRHSDVVGRLAGDEFVVLAVDAEPDSREAIEQRVAAKVAEVNAREGREYQLSLSIGVAIYDPAKPEMVEEVLARADALMYESKRARKVMRTD